MLLFVVTLLIPVVRGIKLTLPLRREKSTSDCGELIIELDDLHMTLSDTTATAQTTPRDSSVSPAQTTATTSHGNHLTAPSTSTPVIRTVGSPVEGDPNRTSSTIDNHMSLITLDTPESSRRLQPDTERVVASTGSSRQPSPSTSPTPTTRTASVGAVGVATGAAVGAATTGGRGGSVSSQPNRSRQQAANTRPRPATNPTSPQPRPPQQQAAPGPSYPQQSTSSSHPQAPSSKSKLCSRNLIFRTPAPFVPINLPSVWIIWISQL